SSPSPSLGAGGSADWRTSPISPLQSADPATARWFLIIPPITPSDRRFKPRSIALKWPQNGFHGPRTARKTPETPEPRQQGFIPLFGYLRRRAVPPLPRPISPPTRNRGD